MENSYIERLIDENVKMKNQIDEVKEICERQIANEGEFTKNPYSKINPEEIANVFGWKIARSLVCDEYELREVME